MAELRSGPILVTGGHGLLGRELGAAFRSTGAAVHTPGHDELDVTDAAAVRDAIGGLRPSVVVHCAAMTDVDACEDDPDLAWAVNVEGTANVARAAADVGAYVVAVSTDYVFDGERGAYAEDDRTNPIQTYGRTKLAGEDAVRDALDRYAIVRSAWIYGAGGKNFLSKLPGLAKANTPLNAVVDQTGSPTYAPDLADGIVRLTQVAPTGVFHIVNEGACTFAEFCRHALRLLGATNEVTDITRAELARPAPRPANTSLVGEAWCAAGFPPLRPWSEAAAAFCAEAS